MAGSATPLSMVLSSNEVAATGTNAAWLSKVGVAEFDTESSNRDLELSVSLVPLDESVKDGTPLVDVGGATILLGPWNQQTIDATLHLSDGGAQLTMTAGLTLRLGPPAFNRVNPNTLEIVEDDPVVESLLGQPSITLEVALDDAGLPTFDISFDFGGSSVTVDDPFMIGETGIIIDPGTIALNFSGADGDQPSNAPDDWTGVYLNDAKLYVPEVLGDMHVEVTDFGVGSGGVYGEVSLVNEGLGFDDDKKEFTGDGAGDIGGFAFGLREVEIELKQSTLVAAAIDGELYLPYFEKRVSSKVGFDMEGSVSVRVTGPTKLGETDDSVDPESGLLTLDTDAFKMTVASVELTVGDPSRLAMSGTVTPTVDALDLPGLDIEELAVDSNGDVHFKGGWVNLPDQYSVDFYGVTLELSKLGFGKTDAGELWLGLDGSISIVDGVPAGASVEGLRIFWDDDGFDRIELNGVGVEFEVPGTLRFKGEVAFGDEQFTGGIELELISLGMTIDAELVVGEHEDGFTYFGIYLDADLPSGIPLFSTGTGIYGFAGLFAHQMEPDKGKKQKWYDISADGSKSWYHQGEPGVTDLTGKWRPQAGSMGLGAGVSIATLPDNGFSMQGDLMLVLVFPGPIIMLQGKAKMLSAAKANKDSGGESGGFRTLAVLDNREGSFTFGMDAQYQKGPKDSPIIDISGGVEGFFSFHDPTAWHLYIGRKKPPEDRIQAKALYLFTADAYFMLDADRLALGAKVGYDADWTFGPIGVIFEAWIAGDAMVNWNPLHFFAQLKAHGKVALKAFGFSIGMTVDARVAADVDDPFHLIGEFSVSMSLPWPLPSPSAEVTLEWGPKKAIPPVPRPLEGAAVGHQKATTRWPLSRESTTEPAVGDGQPTTYPPTVRPNYAEDGLLTPGVPGTDRPDSSETPPDTLPVVPADARPRLTFAKPVHDDGNVGVNHQPVKPPREVIGDPSKNEGPVEVRYGLQDVRLKKREGSSWIPVNDVYGSWAPLPKSQAGTGGATRGGGAPALSNTKLEIYSKNPFDYGRHTHGTWEEGTQRLLEDYPCTVDVECFEFDGLAMGDFTEAPVVESGTVWHRLVRDGRDEWPTFAIEDSEATAQPATPTRSAATSSRSSHLPTPRISRAETPEGPEPALVYPRHIVEHGTQYDREHELLRSRIRIDLGTAHPAVELVLGGTKHESEGTVTAYDGTRSVDSEQFAFESLSEGGTFVFDAEDGTIDSLVVDAKGAVAIVEVCESDAPFDQIGPQETNGIDHTRSELVRWSDEADVLEPNTVYRLEVDTVVEASGKSGGALANFSTRWYDDSDPITEFVYFRTGGPPGVDPGSSLPTTVEKPAKFSTGLEDLTRYVRETVPETVPAEGEQPSTPRPVYRAYDVGVDFSEDYVETLYRLARRDLGLYLFDANDRPVRDVDGRLVATENQWGKTDSLLLDDHDRAWLRRVRASGCMDVTEETIPLDDAMAADDGVVLAPETSFETRLSPLLLRDGFDDGLGHWQRTGDGGSDWSTPGHDRLSGDAAQVFGTTVAVDGNPDLGAVSADVDSVHFPADRRRESGDYRITAVDAAANEITVDAEPDLASDDRRWRIAPRHVLRQTATVTGGAIDAPESTLELTRHPVLESSVQSPTAWMDYRVQATVRADQVTSGAVGIAFRRDGSGDCYRFELDADENAWRLLRVTGGNEEELARHERLFAGGSVELSSGGNIPGGSGIELPTPWIALGAGRDYRITVEAVGSDLRVHVDGEPVISVEDDALSAGTVGVYCRAVTQATVPEFRVDDYRRGENGAPVPYRFQFVTSKYANFFHHAHSYQDETWSAAAELSTSGSHPTARLDAATTPDLAYADVGSLSPPDQAEVRSFDAALSALAGDDSLAKRLRKRPDRVQVTRFDGDGGPLAYLLRSPEPLDWARTDLDATVADDRAVAPAVPNDMKITSATLGSDESVTLMLREAMNPTGYAVDYRRSTEPGFAPTLTDAVYRETFEGSFDARYDVTDRLPVVEPVEPVERPRIEPPDGSDTGSADGDDPGDGGGGESSESGAGGRIEFENVPADGDDEGLAVERQFIEIVGSDPSRVDLSRDRGPSVTRSAHGNWRIEDGAIIGGGSGTQDVVARRGRATEGTWTATVSAADPGEVGLLFRYNGEDDHYRFSLSADAGLRLVHRHGGTTDVLWRGTATASPDREYRFAVVAADGQLRGYLDGAPTFVISDPGGSGAVGVHAGSAGEVAVTELAVHRDSYRSVLFEDDFSDGLDAWTFTDVPPYTTQESDWHVTDGRLNQTSNIYGHVGNEYHEPGTHGVAGDADWYDYRATVTLGSGDNDAIGLLVRYQDPDNYYRLSMDHEREYRRLVKRVDGATYLLWEDDEQYDSGREYVLTVECVGDIVRGYIDGEQLFAVEDGDLAAGKVGVYCRASEGAYFDDVRVAAPADGWVPYYEFETEVDTPAGTRVRVNRNGAGPDEVGLVQRDVAPDGDAPAPLPASAVELRVRGPETPAHAESAGHRRWFRPEGEYAGLSTKALRNADGTGLLLVPAEPVDPSQLRLTFTYHRDGGERMLRQAGSSEPEHAVLDVPWPARGPGGE